MNRRRSALISVGIAAMVLSVTASCVNKTGVPKDKNWNVLLITADDLNWNSVGAYGCEVENITPNIDNLAQKGMRFSNAHVSVAVCQPSRGAIATGLYPHNSGIEGFYHTKKQIPTIINTLNEAGYLTGVIGKREHSTPREDTPWDVALDMEHTGMGRNKDSYYREVRNFIRRSKEEGRPFYLMANSRDPHRPFAGSDQEKTKWPDINISPPSRTYRTDEVSVPDFLPDLPQVRLEISEYYSSVKRLDDTVGKIMQTLKEEGVENNTLVMFLSDNGMALPFAKTNCYLHSTKTPWIVWWPGEVQGGLVDSEHFISGIDFFPTILDALGMDIPEGLDGKSFLPLLKGNKQENREVVYTQFYETKPGKKFPMRCVQDQRFGYIYNFWSDGETVFRNESQSGRTFKAMNKAAQENTRIKERVKLFKYRVKEEFYDFRNDPDALNNLIDDPKYQEEIKKKRKALADWMKETNDPLLDHYLSMD